MYSLQSLHIVPKYINEFYKDYFLEIVCLGNIHIDEKYYECLIEEKIDERSFYENDPYFEDHSKVEDYLFEYHQDEVEFHEECIMKEQYQFNLECLMEEAPNVVSNIIDDDNICYDDNFIDEVLVVAFPPKGEKIIASCWRNEDVYCTKKNPKKLNNGVKFFMDGCWLVCEENHSTWMEEYALGECAYHIFEDQNGYSFLKDHLHGVDVYCDKSDLRTH